MGDQPGGRAGGGGAELGGGPGGGRGGGKGMLAAQVVLGLAVIGAGAYLYFTDQGTFWPILLAGVGLSFMPGRIVGLVGGVVCLAAGGYWVAKHGQGGILYGVVALILGGSIILDRMRKG
jgi:hypothetical protein